MSSLRRLAWPFAALALVVLAEERTQAQERQPANPQRSAPFRHQSHVPGAWAEWDKANALFLYDEAWSDCTGCHDLKNPTPIQPDLCKRCHYGGFQTVGTRPQNPNDLFLHVDHSTGLVCRNCHSPRDATGAIDRDRQSAPDDMHVLTGTGSCLACHGPQSARLYDKVIAREKNDKVLKAAEDKLVGVLARLNVSTRMGPKKFDGERGFFHRDHLVGWPKAFVGGTATADAAKSCLSCHASVLDAVSICEGLLKGNARGTTALGDKIFSSTGCSPCHISDGGSPRPVTLARKEWRSVTAGTFSHQDHVNNPRGGQDESLGAARKGIADTGCLTCHPPDDPVKAVTFGLNPAFSSTARVSSYDECARCHVASGQRVQDTKPGDGLDQLTHAQLIRDTSSCEKCHQLGFVTDMKTLPASVKVKRPRGLEFSIATHAHEFIALKGALKDNSIAESCSVCHVSDPTEQVSRIQKAKFNHATHLPRTATAKDCEACHANVGASKGPGDIGTTTTPLYDEAACKNCHKAAPTPGDLANSVQEIAAPLFAHADHVGKLLADGKKLACEACHENQLPDGKATVSVRPEALTCKPCHSHRDAPQYTGKASGEYVASCSYCHKTGVPRAGEKLPPEERIFVAGFADKQLHPPPQERPCDDCHAALVAELAGGATSVATDAPEAVAGVGFWAGTGKSEFHKTHIALEKGFARNGVEFGDDECACCHWAQQGQAEAVAGGKAPFRWPTAVKVAKGFRERRSLADDFFRQRQYPGTPCCK